MLIDTFQYLALEEYEEASRAASELAERIRISGRARASNAEMVKLLKAWQLARDAARTSHDRMLAKNVSPSRVDSAQPSRPHGKLAA